MLKKIMRFVAAYILVSSFAASSLIMDGSAESAGYSVKGTWMDSVNWEEVLPEISTENYSYEYDLNSYIKGGEKRVTYLRIKLKMPCSLPGS